MTDRRVRHLAIRAPNWVGDLAMATPILRAAFDDARFERVSILLREPLAALLTGSVPDDARGESGKASIVRLSRANREIDWLRRERPDAILLLSNSFGAAWRAWRGGVPIRAGSALSGRRLLLTRAFVPPSRDGRRIAIPTAHLLRDVARLVGLECDSLHPRLSASDEERARSRALLASFGLAPDEPYFVCSPGAAFGAAKLWPHERFAQALDRLHERFGRRGVVSGGPGEEELMNAVARATRHGAISLAPAPRDLGSLRALIADAELLLVGDSGPRWCAAAFDVPCVCIMGPNSPELSATSLELCEIVRVEGLECSPCMQRVCPLGHHRCMTEIGVERVVDAAVRVLARSCAPSNSTG